jgi:ribonuclease-3
MTANPAAIEDILQYRFKDRALLKRALTHTSAETGESYERLEFLGDRVLGLIMADALYTLFPGEDEGGLAKRHSALVQGRTLAGVAAMNGLADYIVMGGAERAGDNENILSDVMESLIGAVYLDGGLESARTLVLRLWGDNVQNLETAPQDPKTELQEWAQGRGLPLPKYELVSKDGPDHAPEFVMEVNVQGYPPVQAEGPSRRQAEKTAARIMLRTLKGHPKA